MNTTQPRLLALTAEDAMKSPVRSIPAHISVREAARILHREQISGVPVIDLAGRCVGVFSASDVLRWLDRIDPTTAKAAAPLRTCPYQEHGALFGCKDETVCTLEAGACPLQAIRPLTAGRHVALCLAPHDVLADWQQEIDNPPENSVVAFMTTDVVSVAPSVPLADVARMMIDAHIHRVLVLDAHNKPVGIVSATDVMAALAWHGLCELESHVGETVI